MTAALIAGGASEAIFFKEALRQGHPWAALDRCDVRIVDAGGDSKIPGLVEKELGAGRKVVVLYDSDALKRKHEQADVLENEDAIFHRLGSDFEGAFDVEVVQRALGEMKYAATLDCLRDGRSSASPFENISRCVKAGDDPIPLDKVPLAEHLAKVARRLWYSPKSFDPVFRDLGEVCKVGNPPKNRWLMQDAPAQATGKLFVSNHVSNQEIRYWDFGNQKPGSIPLPELCDGLITPCKQGSRFYARTFQRDERSGMPKMTWVHVFDLQGEALEHIGKFRIRGSVHALVADEDGIHVEMGIQDGESKRRVRCLYNGTQQEDLPGTMSNDLYAAKSSSKHQLAASGPQPMKITRNGQPVAEFPHFYACGYTWSQCVRYLAFFARRWKLPPDFLWIYDREDDRMYRCAIGDQFIPVYWSP